MQITSRPTQFDYRYEDRDYGVSCSSHLRTALRQHRLLVLESAYSWRLLALRRRDKADRKKHRGIGRDGFVSCALLSSRLIPRLIFVSRVPLFRARAHVQAVVRGLVLARQNLTKQFAPKQTTASGLLVNKQHIYF